MDKKLTASRDPASGHAMVPERHGRRMPEQALWYDAAATPTTRGRTQQMARLALLVVWLAAVAAFGWTLYRVLSVETPTYLQLAFLALSTLCFAWVAIGSVTALIGFVCLLSGRGTDSMALPATGLPLRTRTALLFPVYREDPLGVAATIATMVRDIGEAGAEASFDIFVLSDTQDSEERAVEVAAYANLRARHIDHLQIYARWRTPNTGKKAGNIRDWVENFGGAYDTFVILDADSIMSALTLLRLARAMEEHHRIGLIQTVPTLAGGTTLFARLQQFASCYYGQVLSVGLAAWQGRDGNYWGHNAIIRTAAFADAAGLPQLKGSPPLGGHILSHDFVEAALLRRAGWEVHMVPSASGSYEGCPPALSDLIARDRRWAQGNLQHLRLLRITGLPFVSRLHLAFGACAYIASPTWALTLLIGVLLAAQAQFATPSYFGTEVSLFPKWPVFDAQLALMLFIATVVAVYVPKLLGLAWALRTSAARQANGGTPRMIFGFLVESIFSTLIAPILMITQSGAVLGIVLGRDAGWGAQRRSGAASSIGESAKRYKWPVIWGVAGGLICWLIAAHLLAWMSPVLAGLILAPIMANITSGPSRNLHSLLATTHDLQPPALLIQREIVEGKMEASRS
ncbi:MAG: glucans biosynthesis glucosyltransferase MdoH [Hyphomicrobiaceae bacterium]